MSSGSLGLSRQAIESKISYLPRVKKCEKSEPISSDFSKKILADYHAAVDKDRQLRAQLTVQSSAARRPTTTVSSTMLTEGERALQQGKIGEALSCFLEAVRMGESNADLFSQIGNLFRQKEQTTEALEYYTKAILIDPYREESYLARAECYLDIDAPGEAFAEFEKFFKLMNPPKALIVRCGKAALDADLLDEAERYLKRALSTAEDDAQTDAYAWYNLGELAERRKEDELAKENYSHVCESDPAFPDPYYAQAEDEFAGKNFPLALHLFEAVAKMRPEDAKVFTKLAEVYQQLGEEFRGSVLTCLSRAVELAPPGEVLLEGVLVRRGRLLLEMVDEDAEAFNKAIADFTLCLEVNPDNSDALESRGWALQARGAEGDAEASASDYAMLVSLDVDSRRKAYPYRCLAVRACEENRFTDAARLFSFSGACGDGIGEEDTVLMMLAMAHAAKEVENFEEQYEVRQVKEVEKGGKKNELPKPYPVVSLSYHLIDTFYQKLRESEPTVHSCHEYEFIQVWKPYRETIERHKEEMDGLRAGKKPKKGK